MEHCILAKCCTNAERELLCADSELTSCRSTMNEVRKASSLAGRLLAMYMPQPRHPISGVALPRSYEQRIPYTDCEGSSSPLEEPEHWTGNLPCLGNWFARCASAPFPSGIAAHPFPAKQAHSRLHLETANRYRPIRHSSCIPAFAEVPYSNVP